MPEISDEADAKRTYLQQFLQENATQLIGILRAYVVRMGPAPPEAVQALASETFQDAVLETLQHAERFDPTMQPRAWFLAIATNVLKRKRARSVRRDRFEVLTSELASARGVAISESDLLDQVAPRFAPDPEQELEAREQVRELLTLVSPADAEVLTLALLHDLDSSMLARHLGVSVSAARVRLHRAQRRLRAAWQRQENDERRSQKHG